jgi:hypothetical protein
MGYADAKKPGAGEDDDSKPDMYRAKWCANLATQIMRMMRK